MIIFLVTKSRKGLLDQKNCTEKIKQTIVAWLPLQDWHGRLSSAWALVSRLPGTPAPHKDGRAQEGEVAWPHHEQDTQNTHTTVVVHWSKGLTGVEGGRGSRTTRAFTAAASSAPGAAGVMTVCILRQGRRISANWSNLASSPLPSPPPRIHTTIPQVV